MRQMTTPESLAAPWEQPPSDADQTVDDSATSAVAVETPAENAADATETEPPTEDDSPAGAEPLELNQQERELLDAIYKTTVKVSMLGVEERKLSRQLEEIRNELSAANDTKASLLKNLPEALLKLRDGIEPDARQEGDSNEATPEPTSAAPQGGQQPIGDGSADFRSRPTESILEGVPRLGAKKAEALVEKYPTLGDLADGRAEAIRAGVHFADVLPKGIGKSIADELTDRLMNAETAGEDRPASEVVEPRVAKKPEANGDDPPAETDRKHDQWVRSMVKSLKASDDASALDSEVDSETWDEGYQAFEANEPITECPSGLNDDHKLDWLRGWLSAEIYEAEAISQQKAEEAAEEAAEPPAVETSSTSGDYEDVADDDEAGATVADAPAQTHDDWIRETVARLSSEATEGAFDSVVDLNIWTEGYEAHGRGEHFSRCPRGLVGPERTKEQQEDWLRGWLAADLIASQEKEAASQEDASATETADDRDEAPADDDHRIAILHQVAEDAKASGRTKAQVDADAWNQGYEAAVVDESPIEACPSSLPAEHQHDWVRGWVEGSEIGVGL